MKNIFYRKKIDWMAMSVISAMIIFVLNIFWENHVNSRKIEAEKDKIRVMIAYEVKRNSILLSILEGTKKIGADSEIPDKINFESYSNIRLGYLKLLDDIVFKTYLGELKNLDIDEVTLIMEYYSLRNSIVDDATRFSPSTDVSDNYLNIGLRDNYYNFIKLSNVILSRYDNFLFSENQ